MLNGINREDLLNEFWKYDNEVHDAVDKGERIDTQGKETELLRYLQKVAEYKRLYYQWILTWVTFILSASFAVVLNISLNKIRDPNGLISPFYLVVIILTVFSIGGVYFVYKIVIKPKFNACHGISLDIEREIQVRDIMEKKRQEIKTNPKEGFVFSLRREFIEYETTDAIAFVGYLEEHGMH